jgi:hypothetical protein
MAEYNRRVRWQMVIPRAEGSRRFILRLSLERDDARPSHRIVDCDPQKVLVLVSLEIDTTVDAEFLC